MPGEQLLRIPALRRRLVKRGTRPGQVAIDNSHLYILPSRQGLLFAAVLLAMLIGSINYNINMGFMFTFLLGSLALVSILHSYRNLKGITLRAGRNPPVFAGEYARILVHVDNPGRMARHLLTLTCENERRAVRQVATQQHETVQFLLGTDRRGWRAPGRIKVESTWPLGLFRAWSWVELNSRCLVYPRQEPHPPLPPLETGDSEHGAHQGEGMEDFAGLRGFRNGDPLRHVAWKAVARGQPLLVKQFSGTGGGSAWFVWDELPGLDTEQRLSRLCRWVVDADREGIEYGVKLPAHTFAPDSGELHRHQVLQYLALFELNDPGMAD
jgi:uncharacterized protein (DUF58 family)